MPGELLRRSLWLASGLMALIVVGCAGGTSDQSVAPPPTPTAQAVAPTTPPLSSTLATEETTHSPHIVFERETFDLGDLPVDQMFMLHFVYRNTGDAPLILEGELQVETLEGC